MHRVASTLILMGSVVALSLACVAADYTNLKVTNVIIRNEGSDTNLRVVVQNLGGDSLHFQPYQILLLVRSNSAEPFRLLKTWNEQNLEAGQEIARDYFAAAGPDDVALHGAYYEVRGEVRAGGNLVSSMDASASPHPVAIGNVNLTLAPMSRTHFSDGQVIQVTMYGPTGGNAFFDLGSHTGIPMREQSPGVYVGAYAVQPWDSMSNVDLIGHLQLPNGDVADVVMPERVTLSSILNYHNYTVRADVASASAVSILDPTMRSVVDGGFVVRGQATPGSLVRVTVYTTDSDTPGGKLFQRQFRHVVLADEGGRYSVVVTLDGAMDGSHLAILSESLDAGGNVTASDSVVVYLR